MSSGPSRFSLRKIPAPLWVFCAVLIAQVLIVNQLADSRHFIPDSDDMRFYRDWARKISGEIPWKAGEANYPGTAFYGMPGYAYALAGLYGLTGGYHPEASPFLVGLLQAFFHAGTAMFLFLLAGRIFGGASLAERSRGNWLGVSAAALWAAFTPAQVFSAIHMPTAWVVCAFWGLVYWLVVLTQKSQASWWNPWLWMGLLLGVVAMLVASVLLLLPLIIGMILLTVNRKAGWKKRILGSAGGVGVLFAGFYAGAAPCWVHNYFFAQDPVLFSAHDGLNFYLGNHATANGYTKIPDGLRASQEGLLTDSLTIPEREMGHPLKRSEASQYWKRKAQEWISTNRVAWMRLLGVKIDNYWNTFQYDDLSILRLLRIEHLIPPGVRWGQLAPFALAGLLAIGRWRRLGWVAVAVLLLMLALLPVFITERYRMIAAPGLILLMMGGLAWLWEGIVEKKWVSSALYLAALAGATMWTTQPREDVGLWSLDFYKAGIRATDAALARPAGDPETPAFLDRAQAALERSYAYVPENADVLLGLGNVWMVRGRPERAEPCFRRALELNPNHERALANLGQIYSERGQWKEALDSLLAATKLEPENPKRWYALAVVYQKAGRKEEARAAVERGLALRPDHPDLQKLAAELAAP